MRRLTVLSLPFPLVFPGHIVFLAFATLGDATQNRNTPISVILPKEVKASTGGDIMFQYH
jgi:hypothetical protein